MVKRLSDTSGYQASKQRTRIRIRDGYCCQMCKRAVRVGEVDHRIALVNGGSDEDSNLWLLCSTCHADKTRLDLGHKVRTGNGEDGMPTSGLHHWNI